MMKKLISLLFILGPLTITEAQDFSFRQSKFTVKSDTKNTYNISITVEYSGISQEMVEGTLVPLTTERFVFSGLYNKKGIGESNLIASPIRLDLNRDGDTSDIYPVVRTAGGYLINGIRVQQLITDKTFMGLSIFNYNEKKGGYKIYKFGEKGVNFLVYKLFENDRRIVIGIHDTPGETPISEFPNPNIRIGVAKMTNSTSGSLPYSIGGHKNFITYTNEIIFENQTDEWIGITSVIIPIRITSDQKYTVSVKLKNVSPPFIVSASSNISFEKGLRMRTPVKIRMIR